MKVFFPIEKLNIILLVDEIFCLIFTPDYKSIISGSKDHSIKVFDVKTKQQIYHIKEAHDGMSLFSKN